MGVGRLGRKRRKRKEGWKMGWSEAGGGRGGERKEEMPGRHVASMLLSSLPGTILYD